jgi:hypothetical protein
MDMPVTKLQPQLGHDEASRKLAVLRQQRDNLIRTLYEVMRHTRESVHHFPRDSLSHIGALVQRAIEAVEDGSG